MSYRVTRVAGRVTTKSFRVTRVVGRASSNRSFRVTRIVGRATLGTAAGGTFKVTHIVGRARVLTAVTGGTIEPYQIVQLPTGPWVQLFGPSVSINSTGQFVAPAVTDGGDLQFQVASGTVSYHVNPHTVFRGKVGRLDPVFASTHSVSIPTAP
jgi:hypothetical protein